MSPSSARTGTVDRRALVAEYRHRVPVNLRVEVENQRGVLARVTAVIAELDVNRVKDRLGMTNPRSTRDTLA